MLDGLEPGRLRAAFLGGVAPVTFFKQPEAWEFMHRRLLVAMTAEIANLYSSYGYGGAPWVDLGRGRTSKLPLGAVLASEAVGFVGTHHSECRIVQDRLARTFQRPFRKPDPDFPAQRCRRNRTRDFAGRVLLRGGPQ